MRYLKSLGQKHLKQSESKRNLLNSICKVLGLENVTVISGNDNYGQRHINRKSHSVLRSLKDITFAEVTKLRKVDLNIIKYYAEYMYM